MDREQERSAPVHRSFEAVRRREADGREYWSARELAPILEYSAWEKFSDLLDKAMEACSKAGQDVTEHFRRGVKMIYTGRGGRRAVTDMRLSRYACYLIVQNGDPAKSVIARGQTYFAIQTRRQELRDGESFMDLSEDRRRLALRGDIAEHNKSLVAAAKDAGVETPPDYAAFQDHGYKGLYGGLNCKDIHARKKLRKSQKILDHMGSTELAANLFRATQTEEKLRRDQVRTRDKANETHMTVGARVRQTIADLGGTMPEDLPTPEKSIRQVAQEQKKVGR